jgi:hypothetical protein
VRKLLREREGEREYINRSRRQKGMAWGNRERERVKEEREEINR